MLFARRPLARTGLVLAALLLASAISAVPTSAKPKSPPGDWPLPRHDAAQSGTQELRGHIKRPQATEVARIGGVTSWVISEDITGDAALEALYLTAGRVVAVDSSLGLLWETDDLGPKDILGAYDLDGDGSTEVVGVGTNTVFALSGDDGSLLWEHDFQTPVDDGWMKVADVDPSTTGLELVVWPYYASEGEAYAFDQGADAGRLLWTTTPTYENPAYAPGVVVGDIDADGVPEILMAGYGTLRAYDGRTGAEKDRVDFISGPGVDGRNYGQVEVVNLDADPQLEVVVVADGVTLHVAVVQNSDDGLELLHDRLIDYPENEKTLRTTVRSVGDLDADGRTEIALGIFNDTGDNLWHTVVLDALTGFDAPEADVAGLYLHGVRDVDGDGVAEFFASPEQTRVPAASSDLKVLRLGPSGLVEVAALGQGRYVVDPHTNVPATLSPNSRNTSAEILVPEPLADVISLQGGQLVGHRLDDAGATQVWTRASDGDTLHLAEDLDGDGSTELVLSTRDGQLMAEDADGTVLGSADLGALTANPTVADLDGDRDNEVVVAGLGQVRVLDVDRRGRFTERWTREGRGTYVYLGNRESVPLADMDGDGDAEVTIATTVDDNSAFDVVDGDGSLVWRHVFEDLPAPTPGNGVFTWSIGRFNGDEVPDVYVSAFSGGYNTEVSRILDGRDGALIASRDDNPTRPGIGFGPWVGHAAVYDLEGDGIEEAVFLAKDVLYAVNAFTMDDPKVVTGHLGLYHNPTFVDVDGDPATELVMHGGFDYQDVVDFSDSPTGETKWRAETTPGQYLGRNAGIADVDGDGALEVVSYSDQGVVSARDAATGVEEWTYDMGVPGTSLAAVDIDGDRQVDLVGGTVDGRVFALDGADAEQRVIWSVDIGAEVGDITPADVDGDRRSELVVASLDGSLYVIDRARGR